MKERNGDVRVQLFTYFMIFILDLFSFLLFYLDMYLMYCCCCCVDSLIGNVGKEIYKKKKKKIKKIQVNKNIQTVSLPIKGAFFDMKALQRSGHRDGE